MNRPCLSGFTLIELIIALAIAAILATITVPTFNGLVAKSRRSDAISSLLQVQLAQSRWRADKPGYADSLTDLGAALSVSQDGHYRLRIDYADANSFLVTAHPQGLQRDDTCGVFAVDETGPRMGKAFADNFCWRR